MTEKRIAVLINTSSGNQEISNVVDQIQRSFEAFNLNPKIFLIHSGSDVKDTTLKALSEGYPIIVAAGGDGTIGTVAAQLANTSVVLGILPLGTLNHFAKDLNIPLAIKEAVNVIAGENVSFIDAASVNDRIFINNSSLGIYSHMVKHREKLQKLGTNKWLAFLRSLLRILHRYPVWQVQLKSQEKELSIKTPFIFVGNNGYSLTGLEIGARTYLNQHFLSIFIAHRHSRFRLLQFAWHILRGTLEQQEDFDAYQTQELVIDSRKKFLHISLDGEVAALATPLHYKIVPQALKVIVPK
ncbi:MAG TPA: diacylglycerol kinase family protein [Methylomirabilota bacterium]|jgi:diacylglycerol kinase family enzyme|nr:diacylglycerol kinase family protein [Methylomirabilota bacterium]